MPRKRQWVIPKNVLAQAELRRKYLEEPWPEKLILVKSTLDSLSGVRARGQVTKLVYDLSNPYLYIDERDLSGLGDMVTQDIEKKVTKKPRKKKAAVKKAKSDNESTVKRRSARAVTRQDTSTDTDTVKPTGKRKRGRPRKSERSSTNGSADNEKARGVPARDNK